MEISRDGDSDEDEDQNLVDFHRGQNLLQESEQAPEPRRFPANFE